MRLTPPSARLYLLIGAFFIALPGLVGIYTGHSGKLLVASAKIPPGPFHRSVVYIVNHNIFSAYGYSVNVPLEEEDGFLGGPLAKDNAVFMSRREDGGIRFSSAQEENSARTIYGYAGWGPLQLNYEIIRGGWDVIEYDPALVFDVPSGDIWTRARKKVFENADLHDESTL